MASYLYNMGSNDGYDFDTGADENKKESVVNLVGRWELVSSLEFFVSVF